MISKIILKNFKNISSFESELMPINVLIGSNNSGKSSVLQGIHFSIMAEVMRRKTQKVNIPEDSLIYNPSSNFLYLRHNEQYTVSKGLTSYLELTNYEEGDNFSIEIMKGRNEKNIAVHAKSNNSFRQLVTAWSPLYSMYVPGISGIPTKEKYITKAELRSAVARGDANMYIRNIIYRIKEDSKLDSLNNKLHEFFSNITVDVPYNPDEDLYVNINIKIQIDNKEVIVPLEQCGTGALQVLQIISYALYFSPQLFLLDEPDEHLHPNNQIILSQVLKDMSEENNIQIILCTHSRHLLADLSDSAKIMWMQNGSLKESNNTSSYYDILMDIGALDSFDECLCGKYDYVFLTEDSDTKMCDIILKQSGFINYYIFSYKGCGKLETATLLADFIHNSAPNCKIIIHRDRDFMTENEVEYIENQINSDNVIPFITSGSDIESYFVTPQHLSVILNEDVSTIEEWIKELIDENTSRIYVDFIHKRDEMKHLPIYKNNKSSPPDSADLIKKSENDVYALLKIAKGKFLKKKINGNMSKKFQKTVDIIQPSEYIDILELRHLLKSEQFV